MDLVVQQLWLAQQTLHAPASSSVDRHAAEQHLLVFQRVGDCWTPCTQLLFDAAAPSELRLFAAQTLLWRQRRGMLPPLPPPLATTGVAAATVEAAAAVVAGQLQACLLSALQSMELPHDRVLARHTCLAAAWGALRPPTAAAAAQLPGLLAQAAAALPATKALLLMESFADSMAESIQEDGNPVAARTTSPACSTLGTMSRRAVVSTIGPHALELLRHHATAAAHGGASGSDSERAAELCEYLRCFAAWVRLGVLHDTSGNGTLTVGSHPAAGDTSSSSSTSDCGEALVAQAIAQLQSANMEVFRAASSLMQDVLEYAPEALLPKLVPTALGWVHEAERLAALSLQRCASLMPHHPVPGSAASFQLGGAFTSQQRSDRHDGQQWAMNTVGDCTANGGGCTSAAAAIRRDALERAEALVALFTTLAGCVVGSAAAAEGGGGGSSVAAVFEGPLTRLALLPQTVDGRPLCWRALELWTEIMELLRKGSSSGGTPGQAIGGSGSGLEQFAVGLLQNLMTWQLVMQPDPPSPAFSSCGSPNSSFDNSPTGVGGSRSSQHYKSHGGVGRAMFSPAGTAAAAVAATAGAAAAHQSCLLDMAEPPDGFLDCVYDTLAAVERGLGEEVYVATLGLLLQATDEPHATAGAGGTQRLSQQAVAAVHTALLGLGAIALQSPPDPWGKLDGHHHSSNGSNGSGVECSCLTDGRDCTAPRHAHRHAGQPGVAARVLAVACRLPLLQPLWLSHFCRVLASAAPGCIVLSQQRSGGGGGGIASDDGSLLPTLFSKAVQGLQLPDHDGPLVAACAVRALVAAAGPLLPVPCLAQLVVAVGSGASEAASADVGLVLLAALNAGVSSLADTALQSQMRREAMQHLMSPLISTATSTLAAAEAESVRGGNGGGYGGGGSSSLTVENSDGALARHLTCMLQLLQHACSHDAAAGIEGGTQAWLIQTFFCQVWPALRTLVLDHNVAGRTSAALCAVLTAAVRAQPGACASAAASVLDVLQILAVRPNAAKVPEALAALLEEYGGSTEARPLLGSAVHSLLLGHAGAGPVVAALGCTMGADAAPEQAECLLRCARVILADGLPSVAAAAAGAGASHSSHCAVGDGGGGGGAAAAAVAAGAPAVAAVLEAIVRLASSCAACNQKAVVTVALSLQAAVTAAAAAGAAQAVQHMTAGGGLGAHSQDGKFEQWCVLQSALRHGDVLVAGLLGSLTTAHALTRLLKVGAILQELAAVAHAACPSAQQDPASPPLMTAWVLGALTRWHMTGLQHQAWAIEVCDCLATSAASTVQHWQQQPVRHGSTTMLQGVAEGGESGNDQQQQRLATRRLKMLLRQLAENPSLS